MALHTASAACDFDTTPRLNRANLLAVQINNQQTYNAATNRINTLGSQAFSYDANGNLRSTGAGTGTSAYTWGAEGKMVSDAPNGLTTVNVTYDALGRAVEQARGTSYTQIVYGPGGGKLARMNGRPLSKAFVPLSAGATAGG